MHQAVPGEQREGGDERGPEDAHGADENFLPTFRQLLFVHVGPGGHDADGPVQTGPDQGRPMPASHGCHGRHDTSYLHTGKDRPL